MRIAVMGSGGLGGYFGARLAAGGAAVHFIARGPHLQAMRSDGLRIEGPTALHMPRVSATHDPGEVGVVDVVMLCVKLWDTESALQQLRPLVGPARAIISFQNGVLKYRTLRGAYDASQIMGGVGFVATTIDRPGVIRQTGPMQRPQRVHDGQVTTVALRQVRRSNAAGGRAALDAPLPDRRFPHSDTDAPLRRSAARPPSSPAQAAVPTTALCRSCSRCRPARRVRPGSAHRWLTG